MQFQIRDELAQNHIPFGLVLLPALYARGFNDALFPMLRLCVILMVALDMLDQGTVPIAKILPSLVVVRLAVHGEVNAELGLVIARFVPHSVVQGLENGVRLGKGHLLPIPQVGALAPNDRNKRLRVRVKEKRGRFRDLTLHPQFHRHIHAAVLQLVAVLAQLIDKIGNLVIVPDNIGIIHNQAAFLVAQPLAVALGKVHQGVGLLLRRGPRHERLVVDKPIQPVPDGRGLHLLGLPLLLKLGKVAVDLGNQVVGRGPNGFKRGFQLGQLLAGTPPGHIAERVVGSVQPVVLANSIGHALGLHLTGAAVGTVFQFLRGGVLVNGVEGGVGNLMDGGFQVLQLTHALVNGDALFLQMVIAVRPALDVLKGDGDGGSPLQCGEKVLIPLHAAGQLVHGDVGYLPALGL